MYIKKTNKLSENIADDLMNHELNLSERHFFTPTIHEHDVRTIS